jgi:hypothetical protein
MPDLTTAPTDEQKFIDGCYNLRRGVTRKLTQPLRGYRVENVSSSGRVGPFLPSGATATAQCNPQFFEAGWTGGAEQGETSGLHGGTPRNQP